MAFSQGNGRNSRVIMSEINVTPFVDVVLVLLIMFMVTAPMMNQGIEVDLPRTSPAGVETSDEPFILVIAANQKITAGGQAIAMNDLQPRLKAIFETRKNKQIYVQADRKVDYGVVAEAIAEIRAAGISSVGLVTKTKEASR